MKVRKLIFSDLQSIQNELVYLQDKKIATHGNWNYQQILAHLSDGLEFTLENKKTKTAPMPEFIQNTVGKAILSYILFWGFPPNLPNPIRDVPVTITTEQSDQIETLISLLHKLQNAEGPLSPHPIFGKLTKEEWIKLHCGHFAHHLGYVTVDS